jgi:hypothetical protein
MIYSLSHCEGCNKEAIRRSRCRPRKGEAISIAMTLPRNDLRGRLLRWAMTETR